MEEWKDIKGYEGIYQVSSLGRVKRLKRLSPHYNKTGFTGYRLLEEKIMKQYKNKNGYLYVVLHKDSKIKTLSIHRLVANEFISNPNNYPCINHCDENRQNNKIDNLEFCTHKYNDNYGNRNKKIVNALSKRIIQYDKQNNFIKEWENSVVASKQLNICRCNITNCLNERRLTAGGFVWKYVDNVSNNKL